MLGAPTPPATEAVGPRPRPTCSRPCTPCSRRPPRRRRCCWSSRTPTGPTSPRATCSASCSPARSPARSRSWRRTAPTTCTAGTRCAARSRSGRGSAASSGSSSTPLPDGDVRALVAELHPERDAPSTSSPTSSTAPRATRSSSRSSSAPRPAPGAGVPDDLADVLLVRLDRLDDSARQVVRAASVPAAGSPTSCWRRPPGSTPAALDEALRQAVEMNVLVAGAGPLRLPARAARRGGVRRPAARRAGPAARARTPMRCASGRARGTAAELARHARLAMDLDTALAPASAPATRPGPSAARTRRRTTTSRPSSCSPTRAAADDVDVDLLQAGRQRRRRADRPAATRAGRPPCSASSSAGCRPTRRGLARPAARGPGQRAHLIETDEDPAAISAEAVGAATGGRERPAGQGAGHARPDPAGMGRFEEAQAAGLEALALAEQLDLSELASDAITTLSGLRGPGPRRRCARPWSRRSRRAAASRERCRPSCAGGSCWAAPTRTGRSSTRPSAGSAACIERAADGRPPVGAVRASRRAGSWPGCCWSAGEWDERARARPTSPASRRRRSSGRCSTALRLHVETARRRRGRPSSPRCAGSGRSRAAGRDPRRGLEMVPGRSRAATPAAAVASYDEGVAVLGAIWHEWFSARIRLGRRRRSARSPGDAATCPPPSGRRTSTGCERLHADGHTVLDRYTDPSGYWGPEGRAWVAAARRRDAAGPLAGRGRRRRRSTSWSRPGARPRCCFEDFGDVHELARSRAVLAGSCAPPATRPAAREVGDLAREAAHTRSAPSRCSTSCARSAARPARGDAASDDADRPRAGDPRPGGRGSLQRRDRQAAVHQRQDRSASTSPTSWASWAPPAAPRRPPSPAAGGC